MLHEKQKGEHRKAKKSSNDSGNDASSEDSNDSKLLEILFSNNDPRN